jgi:predicted peptidase
MGESVVHVTNLSITRLMTGSSRLTLLLALFLNLAAQTVNLKPGTTLVEPLVGPAAVDQAKLLLKLRALPRQVPSEARKFVVLRPVFGEMRYRLYKPLKFDRTKSYPLVVSLHGGGPRNRFADLLEPFDPGFCYGIGRLVSSNSQSAHPAFVLVPWSAGSDWSGANIQLVMGILDSLRKEFKIDSKRIYVTGQSMGGAGTWTILAEHPNVFAAAIPICGWGEPPNAATIKAIPIWAFHGNADTLMPVEGSRDIVKALLEIGGKPTYWEYNGGTHAGTAERAYCEPQLLDWLFGQTKP